MLKEIYKKMFICIISNN